MTKHITAWRKYQHLSPQKEIVETSLTIKYKKQELKSRYEAKTQAHGKIKTTSSKFIYFKIEMWLIYNVVLIIAVQQSDSVIHM